MRVQFGAIITAGAGKVGGQIIQRGRTGQILRNLTKPISRKTPESYQPRAAMSVVSSAWRSLAPVDRDSWTALASTLTRYNKFGVAYIPTGYQIYSELNLNYVNYFADVPFVTAPTSPIFPTIADWVFVAHATGPLVTLSWTFFGGDVDFYTLVSFYPLQSLGASVPRGSSRLVLVPALSTAETIDL